jgi:hypothetical protein
MKKVILAIGLLSVFGINAFASVTINFFNRDSQVWTWKVKIDGLTKEIVFNGSTTSKLTIQGSATKATVQTKCGEVEVSDGAKIEIKDGCIKFVK